MTSFLLQAGMALSLAAILASFLVLTHAQVSLFVSLVAAIGAAAVGRRLRARRAAPVALSLLAIMSVIVAVLLGASGTSAAAGCATALGALWFPARCSQRTARLFVPVAGVLALTGAAVAVTFYAAPDPYGGPLAMWMQTTDGRLGPSVSIELSVDLEGCGGPPFVSFAYRPTSVPLGPPLRTLRAVLGYAATYTSVKLNTINNIPWSLPDAEAPVLTPPVKVRNAQDASQRPRNPSIMVSRNGEQRPVNPPPITAQTPASPTPPRVSARPPSEYPQGAYAPYGDPGYYPLLTPVRRGIGSCYLELPDFYSLVSYVRDRYNAMHRPAQRQTGQPLITQQADVVLYQGDNSMSVIGGTTPQSGSQPTDWMCHPLEPTRYSGVYSPPGDCGSVLIITEPWYGTFRDVMLLIIGAFFAAVVGVTGRAAAGLGLFSVE